MASVLPYRAGVGIMLINHAREVFVAKRIDTISEAWQMPQGGMDEGEDALSSAYRELEEETGVSQKHVRLIAQSDQPLTYDLPDALIPKLWGGRFRGQRQHWFLMQLEAGDDVINIHTAHPEFSEWKWAVPHDLPDIIVPFKRQMYADIVALFAPKLAALT